jgi:hypothetical protein
VIYEYTALLSLTALGFIVLIRRNSLQTSEIIAAAILFLLVVNMAVLLFLGYKAPSRLGVVLAWAARLVNWVVRPFIHRDYLQEKKAHLFAREVAEGIKLLKGKGRSLFLPFLFSMNNKALLICIMAFIFLTLGTPFSAGTLVGGVSLSSLFMIVSPTPSGVGIVEGMLPLALKMLRVNWDAAVLITLLYRGVTFWFPLVVGIITFRLLGRQPKSLPAGQDGMDQAPPSQ